MFVEKKITELKPHPMNELFFDDIEGEKWEEFLRSVQIQGIMHPLAITEDGTVISGHQRLRACYALNIDTVKCDVWPPMSDDQIIWCMITSNIRQRGSINSPSIKLGRMLMEHWERDMHTRGYDLVMTSTQADENAQHFYRKIGYKDCGGFTMDIPGYEQPMEMIMMKDLRK